MEPDPEPAPAPVFDGKRGKASGAWDHEKGRRRDATDRPRQRDTGPRRARSTVPMATYRISVGKRHKVEPRQIVGAIANEGGLDRSDFGHIDIRGDHSLVELPVELSDQARSSLERTRISGKLIELTPVTAPAGERRKPRTKKRE
jgi:ATP-dependent RNA helicase DeaD